MNRPEIICEIGINFQGDMGLAWKMIKKAKEAGADCAKFQLYDPEDILKPTWFSNVDWQAIKASKLSFAQVLLLNSCCINEGIEFMASAFDLNRLNWLEDLYVKRHKIASRSIFDEEYVRAVQKTGKPYIVSMGWLDEDNVDVRLHSLWLEKTGKENWFDVIKRLGFKTHDVKFLYCVSKYPSALSDLKNFPLTYHDDYNDGFSDHTPGVTAAIVALSRGAQIIEKHVTLDKDLPGPDHAGSITFDELKQICDFRDQLTKLPDMW